MAFFAHGEVWQFLAEAVQKLARDDLGRWYNLYINESIAH